MLEFIRELWALLSAYKFRAYDLDGNEALSIPLSWLFIFLLLYLFSC
jgi:hypothetical protein